MLPEPILLGDAEIPGHEIVDLGLSLWFKLVPLAEVREGKEGKRGTYPAIGCTANRQRVAEANFGPPLLVMTREQVSSEGIAGHQANGTTRDGFASSYFTARDTFSSLRSIINRFNASTEYFTALSGNIPHRQPPLEKSDYHDLLQSRQLNPNLFDENDWSGRGQHAEFESSEESSIPLTVEKVLGRTKYATVTSVRCRRIRLARKTVRCNPRITRQKVLDEVEHLQGLHHAHIVQLIGTYVLGNTLSILLYPAAEWNLEDFMATIYEGSLDNAQQYSRRYHLVCFFDCLTKTLSYIHTLNHPIKHMDIKPKNILVRDARATRNSSNSIEFRVYIADFGISRSYGPSEDCETHSVLTAFSKLYAAPEVVRDWPRGLAADVFSLGCVFAEMLATICSSWKPSLWDELQSVRESNEDGDTSYSENIQPVQEFLRQGAFKPPCSEYPSLQDKIEVVLLWTFRMLEFDPKLRPSSQTLAQAPEFQRGCGRCDHGPDPFETAPELEP